MYLANKYKDLLKMDKKTTIISIGLNTSIIQKALNCGYTTAIRYLNDLRAKENKQYVTMINFIKDKKLSDLEIFVIFGKDVYDRIKTFEKFYGNL